MPADAERIFVVEKLVAARAIPVAFDWFVFKGNLNTVVFRDAEEASALPKGGRSTSGIGCLCGVTSETNLEFPLTRHNFGVGSEEQEARVEASIGVTLNDFSTVRHVGTH